MNFLPRVDWQQLKFYVPTCLDGCWDHKGAGMVKGNGVLSWEDFGIRYVGKTLENGMKRLPLESDEAQNDRRKQLYILVGYVHYSRAFFTTTLPRHVIGHKEYRVASRYARCSSFSLSNSFSNNLTILHLATPYASHYSALLPRCQPFPIRLL